MSEPEISRKFKGIFISREIWLNPNLTPLEKMLVAEIDSFSDTETGCTASNAYLAKFFRVSEGTMVNMITSLRKKGLVETSSFNGRERRLRLILPPMESVDSDSMESVEAAPMKSVDSYKYKEKEEILLLTQEPSPKSFQRQFVEQWCEKHEEHLGRAYHVNGAKDGAAVKKLAGTGETVPHLMRIAVAAWNKPGLWNCKQAASIAGFSSRLNEIRHELNARQQRAEPASLI